MLPVWSCAFYLTVLRTVRRQHARSSFPPTPPLPRAILLLRNTRSHGPHPAHNLLKRRSTMLMPAANTASVAVIVSSSSSSPACATVARRVVVLRRDRPLRRPSSVRVASSSPSTPDEPASVTAAGPPSGLKLSLSRRNAVASTLGLLTGARRACAHTAHTHTAHVNNHRQPRHPILPIGFRVRVLTLRLVSYKSHRILFTPRKPWLSHTLPTPTPTPAPTLLLTRHASSRTRDASANLNPKP